MPHDLDVLSTVDAEFTVTDTFVSRVRRGVRRRRAARAAAVAGLAATVIAVVVVALPQVRSPAPPPAAPTPVPAAPLLDGFRVGYVPPGLRAAGPGDDRGGPWLVTENEVHIGTMAPAPGVRMAPSYDDPAATVSMRRYVRDNGGNWLWITVLRPRQNTEPAGPSTVTRWLAGSQTAGAEISDSFPVPTGTAVLTTTRGTEVTTHDIVITTPDGVVVAVGGNAGLSERELRAVANGLTAG
ncbi:hypothetical protein Aab01nite_42300 [Paractinoplanes abujensis]|uniref:DUF4245 domain-containing protein n=1 Tax=Paractinoplanes abujensis TaxID=882441 RepID=A0A7W7CW81_9ACTN|nr:hypothetical protein [Actinoplanes abujensis]MBB4694146.1 hypothetical protein [Actinoplanes abujensis]GID20640.1 hypothetical protein Aab01nite_42300 [Actinoplanes abujensis]